MKNSNISRKINLKYDQDIIHREYAFSYIQGFCAKLLFFPYKYRIYFLYKIISNSTPLSLFPQLFYFPSLFSYHSHPSSNLPLSLPVYLDHSFSILFMTPPRASTAPDNPAISVGGQCQSILPEGESTQSAWSRVLQINRLECSRESSTSCICSPKCSPTCQGP